MKIITKKELIKTVAKRFYKERYSVRFRKFLLIEDEIIYKKLLSAKSEEDISFIFGNKFWTTLICDGCSNKVELILDLRENFNNYQICEECLKKAIDMFQSNNKLNEDWFSSLISNSKGNRL